MSAMDKPRIVIADQDAIDTFPKEVDQLMSAIGHPEALVTDESQVYDFLIYLGVPTPESVQRLEKALGRPVRVATKPVKDPEIDEHNAKILAALAELMGRPVEGREYLWRLAQELHTANQPRQVH